MIIIIILFCFFPVPNCSVSFSHVRSFAERAHLAMRGSELKSKNFANSWREVKELLLRKLSDPFFRTFRCNPVCSVLFKIVKSYLTDRY